MTTWKWVNRVGLLLVLAMFIVVVMNIPKIPWYLFYSWVVFAFAVVISVAYYDDREGRRLFERCPLCHGKGRVPRQHATR